MCLVFHQDRRINNYTALLPEDKQIIFFASNFKKITKYNYFPNKNTIERNIS